MKTAFVLVLIALMILPAMITMRIMVVREKRRMRDEGIEGPGPSP
ncbi:MAG: hypothetical protein JWO25_3329 [Alphaproteobacteria bacterium]|nr:hypothetical protein [Alphaproteobacteria bacterium]MDB5723060.1 hypothetical protein [Alphaproteobacteria bacterium]